MQTKTETYTVAELLALDTDNLNALAAEVRGLRLSLVGDSYHWCDNDQVICQRDKWRPATDRNQSDQLLREMAKRGGVAFFPHFNDRPKVQVWMAHQPDFDVPGNDARAETVAAIAAWLAMNGRLSQ